MWKNGRRWLLTTVCTLAMLVGLSVSSSAPATLADLPASQHYRLVASEVEIPPATEVQPAYQVSSQGSEYYHLVASGIGNVPVAIKSDSYIVNEGIVLQAEVVPPMESESYRVGGIVPYRVFLTIVVRGS